MTKKSLGAKNAGGWPGWKAEFRLRTPRLGLENRVLLNRKHLYPGKKVECGVQRVVSNERQICETSAMCFNGCLCKVG